MVFMRVVVILCYIFSVYFNSVEAQKCNARDFSQKSQPHICPEGQFCNLSTNQCNKCGQCYDVFENNIKNKKGDIEKILRNLIDKYRKDLSELQKLAESLLKNVNNLETELESLNTLSMQVKNKTRHVQQQMKKLQNDIKKLEEELDKIGTLKSIEDVVNELKTVKDIVQKIQEKLKKLNFDSDEMLSLNIDKFRNVIENLEEMRKSFPKLEQTSLNLALSLESDIDVLESVVNSFEGNGTAFAQKIKDRTNWIEKDLLWLFSALNNYGNVSVDVDALERNASDAKSGANATLLTLNDLLKKHEEFEKHLQELKSELQFYKNLEELQKRYQQFKNDLDEFERLLTLKRRKLQLEKEVLDFHRERTGLQMKVEEFEEKYNKKRLDQLWAELTNALKRYEDLENTKSIDDIVRESKQMIEDIHEIRKKIEEHCRSGSAVVNNT